MLIDERPTSPGAALDRNLGQAFAPGEQVEHELDVFISRRHEQRVRSEGERAVEAAWRESERKHEAARRAANQSAWHAYHLSAAERLRATLGSLIRKHEAEAERYQPHH